jgi:hypothetical protein
MKTLIARIRERKNKRKALKFLKSLKEDSFANKKEDNHRQLKKYPRMKKLVV